MHIVHLEDEKQLQDILKFALEMAMPDITLAQFINSDKAYQYIHEHVNTIDLYVFDIRVPGTMNGLQLARRVRDLKASAPIMLTSAYTQPNQDLLNLLECEYITKPWQIFELTEQITALAKKS